MNASILSQTYLQKLEIMKGIISKIGRIKRKTFDCHPLLNNLQPHLKQQVSHKPNLIYRNPNELNEFYGYNNSDLTCEETFNSTLDTVGCYNNSCSMNS